MLKKTKRQKQYKKKINVSICIPSSILKIQIKSYCISHENLRNVFPCFFGFNNQFIKTLIIWPIF